MNDIPVILMLAVLPPDQFEKAVKNTSSNNLYKRKTFKDKSLGYIIAGLFRWKDTPEGFDYWYAVADAQRATYF